MILLRTIIIFTLLVCSCYSNALANGFSILEQGTKAMGMGNAFVAVSDDPSANWYNPAGLSFQKNASSISFLYGSERKEYKLGNKAYSESGKNLVLPQVYTSYRLEDSNLSVGLAVNSPFSLDTDWTSSKAPFAQVLADANGVTVSQIQTIHINPNIAYQFGEYFSAAVGLSYYNAYKVHFDNQQLKFGGSGDGFGSNAALMFRSDFVNIGLSYRSKVNVDVTGTVAGGKALAVVGLEGVGANASTSFVLPEIMTLGLSFNPHEDVTVSLQAEKTNWSTFDVINILHDVSVLDSAVGGTSTKIPFSWKSTTSKHIGLDWRMTGSSSLRLGYAIIPSSLTSSGFSPRLPLGDAKVFSIGYGTVFFDALMLDVAFSQVKYDDIHAISPALLVYQGVYTSKSQRFSAGLAYRF